jgi:hypothetical protein
MRAGTRITLFGLTLALVFGAAIWIGSLVESTDTKTDSAHAETGHETTGNEEDEMYGQGGHTEMVTAPAGLAVSEGGYALSLHPAFIEAGDGVELRFSITDGDGATVTDFDELHERQMHLIVVRRDGAGFEHLHPEMDEAGTWTAATAFQDAGVYRVFADFSANGNSRTLATDLFVSGGHFEAKPFPEPSPRYETDEYQVTLDAEDAAAGEPASLSFSVEEDGQPAEDLSPYLGANGHLVALREGDLAFLHVHPEEADGVHSHGSQSAASEHDDSAAEEIAFGASFPTPGRYRLYLQFKHQGVVQTAEFTVSVR